MKRRASQKWGGYIAFSVLVLPLMGCDPAQPVWAPDDAISRAHIVDGAPYSVTLLTVLSHVSDSGAHSALLVDAPSQRVLFDPAGTFQHPNLPERNDVIYGMSDDAIAFYKDYHARETHYVVSHYVELSAAQADMLLREVENYGAVAKANCAKSISDILGEVLPKSDIKTTYFPKRLMQSFERAFSPHQEIFEDFSPSDNSGFILAPPLL